MRYLHCEVRIVLSENIFGLAKMYIANSRTTIKKSKRSITDMLTKERKWNHTKCSKKGGKRVGEKNRKNKVNKYKKVTNMVDNNPTISIISLSVNDLSAPMKSRNRQCES